MGKKVFILKNAKTFKRRIRIYRKNKQGKFYSQSLLFTTDSLIHPRQRHLPVAKQRNAEFETTDEKLAEDMFRCTSYGVDFYLKGDPEGKLKKETYVIGSDNAELLGLERLFNENGLQFDSNLSIDVLKSQLSSYYQVTSGVRAEKSKATSIPHIPADVSGDIEKQKQEAREKYKTKYGDDVPDIVSNDVAFLNEVLNNDEFDAESYIVEKEEGQENKDGDSDSTLVGQELFDKYKEVTGKNVVNFKKNDENWIRQKIAEAEGK